MRQNWTQKNAPYIIERILEYGDQDAAQWMMQNYERGTIVRVLMRSRAVFQMRSSDNNS